MITKNTRQQAIDNTFFRRVLDTGKYTQAVIMSIPPGGEIGEEVHPDTDQVLFLVQGHGEVILDGKSSSYDPGDLVLVAAGTKHNFVNKGREDLKIITTYSPPHHPVGTVHKTKKEADAAGY
jgi:mannose-6-phosphate isomerase-like protein (cupin superfamily)